MRVEKEDLFPLSVILLFMLVIPLALWIGFATRRQIVQDLSTFAKVATLMILGFASLVACSILWSQRRNRRMLAERGEQVGSDFSRQFAGESQQQAASLIFDMFKSMTAFKRMPRLDRSDRLDGPPLFLASEDLAEHLEELLQRLDICAVLDPEGATALHSAATVEQLVLALAHFVERQGMRQLVSQ